MELALNSSELKTLFVQSVSLGGSDLDAMAQAFSALCREFRTEVVDRICCTSVQGKPYTWIDPPGGRTSEVMLFFHGGGYTMGSTDDHLQLIASLVDLSGISFLGVDYRLCPSVRFPAPLDDAEAAYCWLLSQGMEATRIGLAGISAGGALVTQLVHRCAVHELDCPAVALVMSGLNDFRFGRPSIALNAGTDLVSLKRLEAIVEMYLSDTESMQSDDLLCLQRSYSNYPKTLFQVGDQEILMSDAIDSYLTLRKDGHDVALHVVPSMIHCGQLFAGDYRPGRLALEQAARFIRAAFDG